MNGEIRAVADGPAGTSAGPGRFGLGPAKASKKQQSGEKRPRPNVFLY